MNCVHWGSFLFFKVNPTVNMNVAVLFLWLFVCFVFWQICVSFQFLYQLIILLRTYVLLMMWCGIMQLNPMCGCWILGHGWAWKHLCDFLFCGGGGGVHLCYVWSKNNLRLFVAAWTKILEGLNTCACTHDEYEHTSTHTHTTKKPTPWRWKKW